MELLKELGRRIQKARKEKGLTQQELADQSHFSLKHVQSCERGVKNPSFEVLRAFCKVLNLSLDSLMNLDLQKMSKPPTICGSFIFHVPLPPEKCC